MVEAYLFAKNSDEYSVAFRSFTKEGGHPKRCEEMFGLCEFPGFVAIITTISNNTSLTHGVSLRSRRLEVVGERENGRARGRHARGEEAPARKAPENRFNSHSVSTDISNWSRGS